MKKMIVMVILFITSTTMASANFFDGLSQASINWIKSNADAAYANEFNPVSTSTSIDGNTIQVSFDQHMSSYWVSVSDRGQFQYNSYYAINDALGTALTKETLEVNAAAANTESHSSTSDYGDKEPLISSDTPIASADKTGLRMAEHIIAPRSKTKSQKAAEEASSSANMPTLIGGNISYEDFDVFGVSGETFEVVASAEMANDLFSYGVLLPLTYVDFANGDWSKLGLTSYIRKEFDLDVVTLSLGFNASVEQTWMNVDGIDDSMAYGAGPLISVITDLGIVEIKAGISYQYTDNSEYDSVDILTSALNIGVPVGDNFIFNVYGYNVSNQDSDNDYWKFGGEATYMLSGVFGFTAGFNTVEDHDFYESDTYYIGSSWKYS